MDKDIEQHIRTCHPCQIVGQPDRPEPVQPTNDNLAWTELAIDVCGPFPTGEYVVSLTDYYSRWPEATILRTVTSAKILEWLNNVFATYVYPKQIKSDNASYFIPQDQANPNFLGNPATFRHTILASSKRSSGEIQPSYTQARPYLKHNWKRLAKIPTSDAPEKPQQ